MNTSLQMALLSALVWVSGASIAAAQTQTTQDASGGQPQTSPNLFPPPQGWPRPVDDEHRYSYFLADLLEYRPARDGGDFRWDGEGWYGGEYNRLWFKSDGEQSAAKAERNIDVQLLYGRFIRRYYDFQIGGHAETRTFRGASVTRGQAVVGIEGLVPYRYEIEALLFISRQGDVSGRFKYYRDYMVTQRWILQPRLETNIAAQRVEQFGIGRGLNDIELGLRLRYAIRREFAPYIGVSYERRLFGTADFARQDGANPGRLQFVAGLRIWR